MSQSGFTSVLEKFSTVASKVGNLLYLRTLRDSFSTLIPLYVIAGIATLLSSSVFPLFLSGDALDAVSTWSTVINNGTLNFCGVVLCGTAAYFLATNRRFDNKIACVVISLATLIIMMPVNVTASLADGSDDSALVTGALIFTNLGSQGLFAGIIIGIAATEVFIKFSSIDKLKVNLGEGVPPAVSNSFNVLIPAMLTMGIFGIISAILFAGFNTDLLSIIATVVTEPLKALGTSLPAVLLIYTCGNLLFFFGIHQTTINGVLLDPIMLVFMNENMAAVAAGQAPTNLLTSIDASFYGQIGGTGCTLCLIIATYLVGKSKASKAVCSLSVLPGIFNINEPMIFGYPIVYNLPLLIPYLLIPDLFIAIHYFCMATGLTSMSTVYIPWNTPPLISGFLSTGGDVRTVILQVLLIILGVLIYMPFVKLSERVQAQQLESQEEAAA